MAVAPGSSVCSIRRRRGQGDRPCAVPCTDCRRSAGAPMMGRTSVGCRRRASYQGHAQDLSDHPRTAGERCAPPAAPACSIPTRWFCRAHRRPSATYDDPDAVPDKPISRSRTIGWMEQAHELPSLSATRNPCRADGDKRRRAAVQAGRRPPGGASCSSRWSVLVQRDSGACVDPQGRDDGGGGAEAAARREFPRSSGIRSRAPHLLGEAVMASAKRVIVMPARATHRLRGDPQQQLRDRWPPRAGRPVSRRTIAPMVRARGGARNKLLQGPACLPRPAGGG